MDNGAIIPGAEPFYFPGGETGCLLVHGLTGTPKEMRLLGEFLAAQGHSVLAVRLAGHATRPQDLARTRWQDWLASVEDGWDLLRGVTRQIYVMGLSLGGVLSLIFTSHHPVAGVVAMSTPYQMPSDPRLAFLPLLQVIMPRAPKGEPDWRNLAAAGDHIDYPFYPTRSIGELSKSLVELRSVLPNVTVPALLAHSREDISVPPENMELIYTHLGSRDKTRIYVENSGHVIIREPQREIVFHAIAEFINREHK